MHWPRTLSPKNSTDHLEMLGLGSLNVRFIEGHQKLNRNDKRDSIVRERSAALDSEFSLLLSTRLTSREIWQLQVDNSKRNEFGGTKLDNSSRIASELGRVGLQRFSFPLSFFLSLRPQLQT